MQAAQLPLLADRVPVRLHLITCERGLGKLRPEVCGRRWAIAHGKVDITGSDKLLSRDVCDSPCRACTHGEARATEAATRAVDGKFSSWGGRPLRPIKCKTCPQTFRRRAPAQKQCDTCKANVEAERRKRNGSKRKATNKRNALKVAA